MNLLPTEDRVVLEVVTEDRTPGGLYLPDGVGEKHQVGRVVAIGPGKYAAGTIVPCSPVPATPDAEAARQTGYDLGYGRDETAWTAAQAAAVTRLVAERMGVESGLRVGDLAHYGRWAGVEIKDQKSKKVYRVMAALEILAIEREGTGHAVQGK